MQIDQPRQVRRRQAVAERLRDRDAEARARRADAQIARQRDRAAATDGGAVDHGQRSTGVTRSSRSITASSRRSYAIPSSPDVKRRNCADVGARGKRAAGAANDEDAQRRCDRPARSVSTSASYMSHVSALRA